MKNKNTKNTIYPQYSQDAINSYKIKQKHTNKVQNKLIT